jgi:hypothetical protein
MEQGDSNTGLLGAIQALWRRMLWLKGPPLAGAFEAAGRPRSPRTPVDRRRSPRIQAPLPTSADAPPERVRQPKAGLIAGCDST